MSTQPQVLSLSPEALLQHTAWMRAMARKLVLDADRVEDVVQEAWAAALARPPSREGPLRAWLAGVVRNQVLLARRGAGRRERREAQATRNLDVPSAAELSARAESQRLLLEEVQTLSEPYREVLLLRYFEDQKPARIARHLGIPVATVRTRLQRALERLRERLDGRHGGDRRAWGLALLPLAGPSPSPSALLSSWKTSKPGAWIMSAPLTSTLIAALTLSLGVGLWGLAGRSADGPRHVIAMADPLDPAAAPVTPASLSERTVVGAPGAPDAVELGGPSSPSVGVSGRVVDVDTGEAVAGAAVLVHGWIEGGRYGLPEEAGVTSEDGSFRVEIPRGPDVAMIRARHPDYQEETWGVEVARGGNIALKRLGAIQGVVLDRSGLPLADVPLLLDGEKDGGPFEERASTSSDGRFVFPRLHPGRYRVSALRDPRHPDEMAIANRGCRIELGEVKELEVVVRAPNRIRLRGRVVAPRPVGHELVPVFVPHDDEGAMALGRPDGDGYVVEDLERGSYLVLLCPADDDHSEGPFALIPEVVVTGFEGEVRDFSYPTGRLDGRVVVAEPDERLRVVVVPVLPAGQAHDLLASERPDRWLGVPLAADGTFAIDHLSPGPHLVQVRRVRASSPEEHVVASREVVIEGHTILPPWKLD